MSSYPLLHTTQLLTDPPLAAFTYRSPHRESGRRIVVTTKEGQEVFDTGDHVDIANACEAVDHWFTQEAKQGKYRPKA